MFGRHAVPRLAERPLELAHHLAPGAGAHQIYGDALELGNAGASCLAPYRTVVAYCGQGYGLLSGLADVAALRHAGHDHGRLAFRRDTLVNVPQRPVAEAGTLEVGHLTRRIKVMAGSAAQAGVQQPDIHRVGNLRFEASEQAFRGVGLGETDAVDSNGKDAPLALHGHRRRAAAEDSDRVREDQLPGDPGQGVVVAADDEHPHPSLVQPVDLIGKEPGGLHRSLLAVVEVAREQQGVHLLVEA